MSNEIDPDKFYPFSEAARLIPSCRAGKTLSPLTLYQWVRRGELRAELRQCGQLKFWFVQGAELLRLQAPRRSLEGRTVDEARRAAEKAIKRLRKMGVQC